MCCRTALSEPVFQKTPYLLADATSSTPLGRALNEPEYRNDQCDRLGIAVDSLQQRIVGTMVLLYG